MQELNPYWKESVHILQHMIMGPTSLQAKHMLEASLIPTIRRLALIWVLSMDFRNLCSCLTADGVGLIIIFRNSLGQSIIGCSKLLPVVLPRCTPVGQPDDAGIIAVLKGEQ